MPAPAREAAVIARAVTSAPSQLAAALTGDHDSRRTPSGRGSVPEGSNSHTSPISARAWIVASITSGLVEVLTAGPQAAISAGIITAVVFPDRGRAEDHRRCLGVRHGPFPTVADTEIRAAADAQESFAYTRRGAHGDMHNRLARSSMGAAPDGTACAGCA